MANKRVRVLVLVHPNFVDCDGKRRCHGSLRCFLCFLKTLFVVLKKTTFLENRKS